MNYSNRHFGHYRLLKRIGRGGFADVYMAKDLHLARYVAIKVLNEELVPNDQEAFLREARILAHLDHPNIIRIIEFDIQDNIPYLVMVYAPNGSLRERHPLGDVLSLNVVINYVWQIANAISYIHEQGFIHQDIKPENLLLGPSNELLLADFSIAAFIDHTQFHKNQNIMGTKGYIAPERLEGKAEPASDQYSLAVLVYEWLTGEALFYGPTSEILQQHLIAPIPHLPLDVVGIPHVVRQVLVRALAKKPEERFEDVQAFALALNRANENVLDQINSRKQAQLWNGMAQSFVIACFISLIIGFVFYIAKFGLSWVLLSTSISWLFISLLGAFLKLNHIALKLIIGTFIVATISTILFHSYIVFCLIVLVSLLLSSFLGLVVSLLYSTHNL